NVTSQISQIDVIPDPTITIQPIGSQTLCQGDSAQTLVTAATGGSGVFSYQWYSNGIDSTAGGTLIPGAISASFTPTTANVGTVFYYCVIMQPTAGCSVTSAAASVTVNTSPSVTAQPASSQVCMGGIPQTLSFITINGVGSASYQWYSNTSNSTIAGTAISGAIASTYI